MLKQIVRNLLNQWIAFWSKLKAWRSHQIDRLSLLFDQSQSHRSSVDRAGTTANSSRAKPVFLLSIADARSRRIQQNVRGDHSQVIGEVGAGGIAIANVGGDVYLSRPKPTGKPFQAPPLPSSFTSRPKPHQAIKRLLLNDRGIAPGTLVVSAIYGLGGIGKSTLVSGLAHDPEVQEQFPDGILWATLGQQPDLLSFLNGWIQALGDYDFRPTTPDAAALHLRTLLRDKRALLVVDDVWKSEHIEPFRVGGAGCRVLVTTREAQIPGATCYDLDVMNPEQALELMERSGSDLPMSEVEREQAKALAKTVGYLPLALELAAAQLSYGVTWTELLEDLQAEVARLESLDRPGAEGASDERTLKQLSLVASFNLSLRRLSAEQLQQFAWLGVTPEDVSIYSEMAATLWEVTSQQAGSVLRTFRSKALLLSGATQPGERKTFRIHDLMHDRAKQLLTSSTSSTRSEDLAGLGLSLPRAHIDFLKRYYKKTHNGQWHTLPDDGYIHKYLTWHLEQAQRLQAIHRLLQETTPQGRNAWYETCDKLGQISIFVADVGRAWRLAETTYSNDKVESVALQFRYALIQTSLNSLAKSIPAQLMAALVAKQKWTPAQGLAYASQIQEPKQQALVLGALAPYLPEKLLEEAWSLMYEIKDEASQVSALSGLASYLPEQLLEETCLLICRLQDEFLQAKALTALASRLQKHFLEKAWAQICSIQDGPSQVSALSGLIPYLPKQLLAEALLLVRDIKDEPSRASALSGLASYLPERLLKQALTMARSIKDESSRALALGGLAPYLPKQLLDEALSLAHNIQDESDRALVLSALAPRLPEQLKETWKLFYRIQRQHKQALVLSVLAPHLPRQRQLLEKALNITMKMQDEPARISALGALAPYLSPELLGKAFTNIRYMKYPGRGSALVTIAPHLPESLLKEALNLTCKMRDESLRASTLSGLAPYLSEQLIEEAWPRIRSIRRQSDRAQALNGLAPYLPEQLLEEALALTQNVQDEFAQALTLSELASYLPEMLDEALATARRIRGSSDRAVVLSNLVSQLPEPLLKKTLQLIRGFERESDKALVVSTLAAHLPKASLEKALSLVRRIQDEPSQAIALSALVPHLPEILDEAWALTCRIQDEPSQAKALSALASCLSEQRLEEAWTLIIKMQDLSSRAMALRALAPQLTEKLLIQSQRNLYRDEAALSALAPHLPERSLEEVWKAVCFIRSPSERVSALSALAPHLPKQLLKEAWSLTCNFRKQADQARALSALAPYLPKQLLEEAWLLTYNLQDESDQVSVFKTLIPCLPERLLEEAWLRIHSFQDESNQVSALTALVSHLPRQLLEEAWSLTRSFQDESNRARAFGALMIRLDLNSVDFRSWCEVLHTLAYLSRSEFLSIIPKLIPTVVTFGTSNALSTVGKSIPEICKQWQ